MLKYISVILLILTSFQKIEGQILSKDNFIEISIPEPWSKEWYDLNHSVEKSIKVYMSGDSLRFELNRDENVDAKFQLPNGVLLSKDFGEFGGGIYFKPDDKSVDKIIVNGEIHNELYDPLNIKTEPFIFPIKKNKIYNGYFKITYANANSFLKFQDSLYYTDGIAHLGTNEGHLYKIDYIEDAEFKITKVLDLEGAPMISTIKYDKMLFVTHNGLLLIKDFKKIIQLKDLFWNSLSPNSVVYINDENIFVGMRGCYAKVNLIKYTIQCFKLKH